MTPPGNRKNGFRKPGFPICSRIDGHGAQRKNLRGDALGHSRYATLLRELVTPQDVAQYTDLVRVTMMTDLILAVR